MIMKTKNKEILKPVLIALANPIITFFIDRDIDFIDVKVNAAATLETGILLFALHCVASTIGLSGGAHFWAVFFSLFFAIHSKLGKFVFEATAKAIATKHYKKYSQLYSKES